MRGAPHYYILLWIDGASVAGKDDDDVVLIQERITCRIPNEASNPELHKLVTKYQYHIAENDSLNIHSEKLQKMLKAIALL